MKADPGNTLPLSTTAAFTPAVRWSPGDGRHWARALASAAAPAELLAAQKLDGAWPADAAHSRATRLPPGPRTGQEAGDCSQRAGAASVGSGPAANVARRARSNFAQPAPVAARATASMCEPPAADADAPARLARQPLSTRPGESAPVRIHIEQQPGGLAVWLGVDARLGGQAVAAMLQEFKQCRGRLPIASIVCNGCTVYAPPSSSKEIP